MSCPVSTPRALVKYAESRGWRAKKARKGLMMFPPDKARPPVCVHFTYSCHRSLENTWQDMRRSGLT